MIRAIVGLSAVVCISGCATITRGSSEAITFKSTPSGATVDLSFGRSCKTPCTIMVKRRSGFGVKFSKEGYETVETEVVSEIAPAGAAGMAGNVILGGLIGAGVDAMTGATKRLIPNPLEVTLTPLPADKSAE